MYHPRLMTGPEAAYRSVDLSSRIESASPHGLVAILYEELLGALGVTRTAVRQKANPQRAEAAPRALTILQALEGGLDHEKGGDVARTLAQVYRGLRAKVSKAVGGRDMDALDEVRRMVADLAGAWNAIK